MKVSAIGVAQPRDAGAHLSLYVSTKPGEVVGNNVVKIQHGQIHGSSPRSAAVNHDLRMKAEDDSKHLTSANASTLLPSFHILMNSLSQPLSSSSRSSTIYDRTASSYFDTQPSASLRRYSLLPPEHMPPEPPLDDLWGPSWEIFSLYLRQASLRWSCQANRTPNIEHVQPTPVLPGVVHLQPQQGSLPNAGRCVPRYYVGSEKHAIHPHHVPEAVRSRSHHLRFHSHKLRHLVDRSVRRRSNTSLISERCSLNLRLRHPCHLRAPILAHRAMTPSST
ncbi:hypothetical protein BD410DRAFT_44924 [Rickenella mellea]|uniref:Uncharacterized protein n=1 Tax=Rickenella mellea TaxID=50990 RepID=A0A4R5XGW9_9AGAM|nr:hypothetical protein BD410DRAFT_44924 [Rickenella mellea]